MDILEGQGLGLTASTRDRKENGSASVSLQKQVLWLSGKGTPPAVGPGHPTHYLLLGMK